MAVYSYHTFVLPFTWESKLNEKKNYDLIVRNFDDNEFWINYDPKNEMNIAAEDEFVYANEEELYYSEYQYFRSYARPAIYGYGKDVVHNYAFSPEKVRNKARYHIYKNGFHYILFVNAIRLKIFNTGVGLFIMECENKWGPGCGCKGQDNLAAVKNINDWGRRITLPFIKNPEQISSICADKLELEIEGIGCFSEDNKQFLEGLFSGSQGFADRVSLVHMAGFIKEILNFGSKYRFSSHQPRDNKTFQIYPIMDDRMFAACVVSDKLVTENMLSFDYRSKKYAFESDRQLEKSLYELIYIDSDNGCSCQNAEMRKEMLSKSIYKRWLDYGSLYAVTDYSLIMLSTVSEGSEYYYLIENFLTQYVQMIHICLAQRASLVKFRRDTAKISSSLSGYKSSLTQHKIRMLMNLQERFTAFESQLCFEEISSQQQAVEMYGMMQEAFRIKEEKALLKDSINSLYEVADTSLGVSVNKIAIIFTWISALLALAALIYDIFFISNVSIAEGADPNPSWGAFPERFVIYGVFALSLIVFIVCQFRYRRR